MRWVDIGNRKKMSTEEQGKNLSWFPTGKPTYV
jgi:hypothetical protein